MITKSSDPVWTHPITIDHNTDPSTQLKIHLYYHKHDDSTLIDTIQLQLSDIGVSSASSIPLKSGELIIRSEEARQMDHKIILELGGRELLNKDAFSRSDPYFKLFRNVNEEFTQIYLSEVIDDSLNPIWKRTEIKMQVLCNGNYDAPLKIEVFDKDLVGSDDFMGETITSLNELLTELSLIHI